MPAQVGGEQSVTGLSEGVGYMRIAPAVLAQPVYQADHSFAGCVRLPEPGKDVQSVCRLPFQFLCVQWCAFLLRVKGVTEMGVGVR